MLQRQEYESDSIQEMAAMSVWIKERKLRSLELMLNMAASFGSSDSVGSMMSEYGDMIIPGSGDSEKQAISEAIKELEGMTDVYFTPLKKDPDMGILNLKDRT